MQLFIFIFVVVVINLFFFFFFTTRNARKEYIVAKYVERRYVLRREEADPSRLYDAVRSRDLVSLLQLYAEGADLAKPLVLPDGQVKIMYSYKGISTPAFLSKLSVSMQMKLQSHKCQAFSLNDSFTLTSPSTLLVSTAYSTFTVHL